jgi:carboxy-terminal domain RNA polymerase II polypeptide A small phosphatase
MSQY